MILLKNCSDTELILTYQQNKDALAFGELYNRYYPKVYKYAVKILKDHDKALDLTQDLFIKIAVKIDTLKEPLTFVSWLFRIAHNDCIEVLRKAKKNRTLQLDHCFDLGEDDATTKDRLDKESQFHQMEKALGQLPEKERNILVEKYLEDKSIIELMEIYGLSESAVKMRLSRSRERMKGFLKIA